MAKQFKSLHPTKFYRDYLNHDIRPDGRLISKFRPVIINIGSIATADGSALVRIGKTTVICGIKAELCPPKSERPNEGFLICNVDLPPLCSSKFRPGPPSDLAQITTRFLADLILNSACIDLKDLCIVKEKLVWCLYADIICLDHDGCIIDACLLVLLTALKTVRLPGVEYDAAIDKKTINEDEQKSLSIYNTPVSTTYAMFEDKVITDPTAEEEEISSGLLTIVVKNKELCSIHKPGGSPLSEEKLYDCISETINHADLLITLINTAVAEQND
ncbi:hypothetical protein RI129_007788 [Pyrocoelia pectoralis]|uniref:Ribosomal RNA-processing protein 43 n=1 Tax=Pyrocoelia pectoralis TaxID=417401 RepID=A0AAN7ZLS2_9COLE